MKTISTLATGIAAIGLLAGLACTPAMAKDSYTFVIVPKVVNPWFDLVNNGARDAAKYLEKTTGDKINIQYKAPTQASVVQQNQILEQSIASGADGIAVDLLNPEANAMVLQDARDRDVKLVTFDSEPPANMTITAIGNDYCEQGKIAANRLVKLLNGRGNVALMKGVPTAPNHRIRNECEKQVFAQHKGIKIVAEGIDNDDIQTGQQQAAAIMQAHPKLNGWVAADAAGPIGIGQAIKEANLVGKVKLVGMDSLPDMINLVKAGVADSSSSTRPNMQGFYAVLTLYQQAQGIRVPKNINTGILFITKQHPEGELQ